GGVGGPAAEGGGAGGVRADDGGHGGARDVPVRAGGGGGAGRAEPDDGGADPAGVRDAERGGGAGQRAAGGVGGGAGRGPRAVRAVLPDRAAEEGGVRAGGDRPADDGFGADEGAGGDAGAVRGVAQRAAAARGDQAAVARHPALADAEDAETRGGRTQGGAGLPGAVGAGGGAVGGDRGGAGDQPDLQAGPGDELPGDRPVRAVPRLRLAGRVRGGGEADQQGLPPADGDGRGHRAPAAPSRPGPRGQAAPGVDGVGAEGAELLAERAWLSTRSRDAIQYSRADRRQASHRSAGGFGGCGGEPDARVRLQPITRRGRRTPARSTGHPRLHPSRARPSGHVAPVACRRSCNRAWPPPGLRTRR